MKITISGVVAGPAWGTEITLTAGLYASPEGFELNGSSVVDTVSILESASQLPIDRGNQINVVSFTYTDQKGSFALSEQDLVLYKASLPNFGLFRFYYETNLAGSPFAYLVGSISNFRHTQTGITTIRRFTLTGGAFSLTLPSPPG